MRSDDAPSALGDFHYRVTEIKNSAQMQEYHQLQAAVYNWILGVLQGYCPETFEIVLRAGEEECRVAHTDVAAKMQFMIGEWRAIQDGRQQLEPRAWNSTDSPWRRFANRRLQQRGDISLRRRTSPLA